jgi:general stress protein YciG
VSRSKKSVVPDSSISVREAGRRGAAVVKKKYAGTTFWSDIGHKGGTTTKEKYGEEYYAAIGAKGGSTTRKRHGETFYQKIGKLGGARVKELIARAKELEGK